MWSNKQIMKRVIDLDVRHRKVENTLKQIKSQMGRACPLVSIDRTQILGLTDR